MYYFTEIDALINGSGILVEDATINSENTLSPIYALGKKFAISQSPTGPQKSNININYIWEVNFDPNLEIINKIKNSSLLNFNTTPIQISIAGLTGFAYLDSYTIKISPNEIGKVSSSYSVFTPLSGIFTSKQTGYYLDIILTGIPPSGNILKVNNGSSIQSTAAPVGSVDWKTDTLLNAIQNLWQERLDYGTFGFDQSISAHWNVNGIKTYKIDSGVRFVKIGDYPSLIISGNWYQLSSGGTNYYNYFTGGFSGLAHGWVLYSNSSNIVVSSPHFDFQYDFRANWLPIYSLGSKIPTQIQLEGAEETFTVIQDIYKNITFTGEDASQIYDFDNSDLKIKAYTLAQLNNDSINYNFDLSNAKIISNSLNAITDDIVRISTIAKKYY